jgi:hypothetical protein
MVASYLDTAVDRAKTEHRRTVASSHAA